MFPFHAPARGRATAFVVALVVAAVGLTAPDTAHAGKHKKKKKQQAALLLAGTAKSAVNSAPVLSGAPVVGALVGQPYAYRPAASDADGDSVTFGIQNKPAWLTFDPANGMLYGTPSATDTQTYANIVISASDGKLTSSTAPFSITVVAGGDKSVALSWNGPTANTDGSALKDLAGYRVYYGVSPRQYFVSLNLPSPVLDSAVVEGLGAGTWYFANKAVNAAGVESDYSAEAVASL
jgi:hypothetical protein